MSLTKSYIFLDIDGVLNSTRSALAPYEPTAQVQKQCIRDLKEEFGDLPYLVIHTLRTIDPIAVGLINRLLSKNASMKIVLSSSHRTLFSGPEYNNIVYGSPTHNYWLRTYLCALNLNAGRLLDVTPVLHRPRGEEVQAWLDTKDGEARIAIIDDGNDFDGPIKDHLILVDPDVGFSADDYYKAADKLGVQESSLIIPG